MENISFLTPYAPVIQLIAGVYLVFFYQTVFDDKFLDGSVQKKLTTNLDQALRTGGEYISEEIFGQDIKKFDTWWTRYTDSVKAVARMGGVYGITLLIYCGIEGFEKKLGLQALLIDSMLYAVYSILVVFVIRKGILCNAKVWVIGGMMFALIGFKFPPEELQRYLNGLWGLTFNEALLMILLISPLGIILAIVRYQVDEWHYDHTNRCFNRTKKIQDAYSNIRMTITSNSIGEAMSNFYEAYGDLLEIKSWRYDKSRGSRDRKEWGLIFEKHYRSRYNYWVSPLHKKLGHQLYNLPRKVRYCKSHYPCEFAIVVSCLCFMVLYSLIISYCY